MKNIIIAFLFVQISFAAFSQNTWTARAGMFINLTNSAYFTIGDFGYVSTGADDFGYSVSTIRYDPLTDSWSQMADAGTTGRTGASGFSINGKGYVVSGADEGLILLNDLLEYDPLNNSWSSKSSIPVARTLAAVFVSGNKAYVSCGLIDLTDYISTTDVSEYDPANDTWTTKNPFPANPRYGSAGFTIGDSCYMTGGVDAEITYTIFDQTFMYDASADAWSLRAPLPGGGRGNCTAFSIGNYGYAGNGIDYVQANDSWSRFDPSTNSWTPVAAFPGAARYASFSFVVSDRAYSGGGEDENSIFFSDVYEYVPDTGLSAIADIENQLSAVVVYPNPVSANAVLYFNSEINLEGAVVNIFDLSGRLIISEERISNGISLAGNKLSRGIYAYSILRNDVIISRNRFVIE